jgi:hypothetical protein
MGMRIDRQGDFPIGRGFYMNDYIMKMELGESGREAERPDAPESL